MHTHLASCRQPRYAFRAPHLCRKRIRGASPWNGANMCDATVKPWERLDATPPNYCCLRCGGPGARSKFAVCGPCAITAATEDAGLYDVHA